jgi:hypothetical protein
MMDRPDPIASLTAVAQALAATPQPGASLAAIDQGLAATIGHRLFTVLVVNMAAGENQRVYTNHPVAYPVGGTKPIVPGSEAIRTVILGGRVRFLRNAAELVAGFPDHALIRSLGCESCVNVPVRWNGTTIAMLNLLHQADWYSEEDVPVLSIFAALAVPAVLEIIKAWPTAL